MARAEGGSAPGMPAMTRRATITAAHRPDHGPGPEGRVEVSDEIVEDFRGREAHLRLGSLVKRSAEDGAEAGPHVHLHFQAQGILVLISGAVTRHQTKHMVPERVQEGSATSAEHVIHHRRAAEDFR